MGDFVQYDHLQNSLKETELCIKKYIEKIDRFLNEYNKELKNSINVISFPNIKLNEIANIIIFIDAISTIYNELDRLIIKITEPQFIYKVELFYNTSEISEITNKKNEMLFSQRKFLINLRQLITEIKSKVKINKYQEIEPTTKLGIFTLFGILNANKIIPPNIDKLKNRALKIEDIRHINLKIDEKQKYIISLIHLLDQYADTDSTINKYIKNKIIDKIFIHNKEEIDEKIMYKISPRVYKIADIQNKLFITEKNNLDIDNFSKKINNLTDRCVSMNKDKDILIKSTAIASNITAGIYFGSEKSDTSVIRAEESADKLLMIHKFLEAQKRTNSSNIENYLIRPTLKMVLLGN